MSNYDGSIRIGTKLEIRNLERNLATMENKVLKSARKVETLQKRLDELGNSKIETSDYKEVRIQLEQAERQLIRLQDRMEKFLETGGKTNSSSFKRMQYDAAELENTIEYAQGEMQDLVECNKAFIDPKGTEAYAKLASDLEMANSELNITREKMGDVKQKLDETKSASSQMKKAMANAGRESSKAFDKLRKSVRRVLLLIVGARTIQTAFMNIRSSIVEVLPTLRKTDGEVNKAFSQWESATNSLKGALTSAFGQIAVIVLPILIRLVNWITNCVNAFAQLIAYLRGQSTWKKVTAGASGASKAINGVGKSAKKAAGQLAAFDELNVLNKNDNTESSGSGAGSSGVAYETVPVDQSEVQSLIDKLKEIVPIILEIVAALGILKFGLMFGWNFTTIMGLIMIFTGLIMMIRGIKDAWENGVNWNNIVKILGGAALIVGGLALAFGATAASVGAFVTGIALIIVGIHDMIENGINFKNGLLVVVGVAMSAFLAFGGWIALIAAAVAAFVLVLIADWDNAKNHFITSLQTIKQYFVDAFNAVFGRFKDFGTKMKEGWNKLINGDILGALKSFREAFLSLIKGIINAAIALLNGMIVAVNTMVNGIFTAINAIINAINKIDVQIPDWVPIFGGKRWSPSVPNVEPLNIPTIPYLATGTVVPANYGEFAAILGDNKRETEVVSPLSTIKEAMMEALRESGNGGGGDVYITADADLAALIKLLKLHLAKEEKRVGRNMNKVVKVNG